MNCDACGLFYDDFRTGLTYKDVFDLFWVSGDDPDQWRHKGRHTVLGKWHEIKLDMWREHVEQCGAAVELDGYLEAIGEY